MADVFGLGTFDDTASWHDGTSKNLLNVDLLITNDTLMYQIMELLLHLL